MSKEVCKAGGDSYALSLAKRQQKGGIATS